MEKTLFVVRGEETLPRWQAAFPGGERGTLDALRLRIGAGDLVWVSERVEAWPSWVRQWSQRGAVVILLSYQPNQAQGLEALEAGARGYVHALANVDVLRQAATVVTHQGLWVGPELLSRVVGSSFRAMGGASRASQEWLERLTERERAVALAVADGQSNKEVARRLEISDRTVKSHLSAIFRKLEVRDRMQLVLRLSQSEAVDS
ncbi:response regulator transcription factor [Halomonas sp. 328]|uniref:response regulator transcription factor n=1 Tax=Halomonas sp. 328 TaxID=2776704 RepID=UPI0018A7402A|nr:response regulator transcription factor [Halomonas sp. 328]MBF8221419.1 response regulator transcription factor [Halomonas sp. 328]